MCKFNKSQIPEIVLTTVRDYLADNGVEKQVDEFTPLIGRERLVDSLGLVNILVDVEMNLMDAGVDIGLTTEAAMSSRISPFRNIGALCRFISSQIDEEEA